MIAYIEAMPKGYKVSKEFFVKGGVSLLAKLSCVKILETRGGISL